MNKSLHLAFLAAAMAAASTLAVAKPVAPPAPQFIGTDVGTFAFSGTGDGEFYVTLDAPGTYTITGNLDRTVGSATNFNLSGATVSSGAVTDDFEHDVKNHYFEDAYVFTVVTPGRLLLDIGTNDKSNGAYTGTLTVANTPVASVVPEPATAALLLAGAGMLGISARRRRNV
jgi:hypothetical protein